MILALGALSIVSGCSEDHAEYTGPGVDGPLVGETVEDGASCGAVPGSGYSACVNGQPVRVVWQDGESMVVDAACLDDRVNVAVDGDRVVGSHEDC